MYKYLYIYIVGSRNHRTFIFYMYATRRSQCAADFLWRLLFNRTEIIIANSIDHFLCIFKFSGPFTNSSQLCVRVCACTGLCGFEQQSW